MTSGSEAMAERILIVEDDRSLSRRLQEALGARWVVAAAASAAEALRILAEDHFDLLLLDLVLPDRDGLDLLREIQREGLASRVVVVTGRHDTRSAIPALRLHAADFLRRPTPAGDLVAAVERALASDPALTAPLEKILPRARRLLRAGRIDGAESQLSAARLHHPDSPELVNLLGVAAELRHDLSRALELYRLASALGLYPPARRNAQRIAFRSWRGPGVGTAIDYGNGEG